MKSDRPEVDRCNICGEIRPLSEDHVPPTFWGNKSPRRYALAFGVGNPDGAKYYFTYKDRKGITYKSICSDCNNKLGGRYDKELKEFCDVLANNMKRSAHWVSMSICVDRVARAVVGHILAAKTFYDDDCIIDRKLREYLEDENALPPEDMHLYCYPYYYGDIIIARDIVVIGQNVPDGIISLISSYPVAVILVEREYPCFRDLFALCTGDCNKKTTIVIDIKTAYKKGSDELRHPYWPLDIGHDTKAVLGGEALYSQVSAKS